MYKSSVLVLIILLCLVHTSKATHSRLSLSIEILDTVHSVVTVGGLVVVTLSVRLVSNAGKFTGLKLRTLANKIGTYRRNPKEYIMFDISLEDTKVLQIQTSLEIGNSYAVGVAVNKGITFNSVTKYISVNSDGTVLMEDLGAYVQRLGPGAKIE